MRSVTLFASMIHATPHRIGVLQELGLLVDGLRQDAEREGVTDILWDTMKLGSDENYTDDVTLVDIGTRTQKYIVWTAEVMGVIQDA